MAFALSVTMGGGEDAEAMSALCRKSKDVFPFLPRAVFMKAAEAEELIICRDFDSVVGGLHFHHRKDGVTTLHEIVVVQERRGQGVGRALLMALEECAHKAGQKRIRLKCPTDQPANGSLS